MRLLFTAVVCLALAAPAAFAQSGQNEADMQKMMEMLQAGPEHQHLAKLAGKWQAAGKMWMDPSAPPMESTGVMEYTLVLDGRYVEGVYKGNFMGTSFEGRSVDGYDRFAKQYFSYWYDSMGTGMMDMHGTASADGKSVTMTGKSFDPMVNGMASFRTVSTWVDDNTINYQMFREDGGQSHKTMEIVYKRM
jgi:hypothetical protein